MGIQGSQTGRKVESLHKTYSQRKDLKTTLNYLEDMTLKHLLDNPTGDSDSIYKMNQIIFQKREREMRERTLKASESHFMVMKDPMIKYQGDEF